MITKKLLDETGLDKKSIKRLIKDPYWKQYLKNTYGITAESLLSPKIGDKVEIDGVPCYVAALYSTGEIKWIMTKESYCPPTGDIHTALRFASHKIPEGWIIPTWDQSKEICKSMKKLIKERPELYKGAWTSTIQESGLGHAIDFSSGITVLPLLGGSFAVYGFRRFEKDFVW